MGFYWFADESVLKILDTLLYVSPVVVVQFLVLSKSLRLCKWHRTACALPLIPQTMVILDSTFISFSKNAAIFSIASMAVMCLLLLVSAYNVFLK